MTTPSEDDEVEASMRRQIAERFDDAIPADEAQALLRRRAGREDGSK